MYYKVKESNKCKNNSEKFLKTFRSTTKQCNFLYETKTSKQIENRTPTRRGFNKVKKVLPPPGFKQQNKNAMLWVQSLIRILLNKKAKKCTSM